jgi:hypothetical protein
MRKLRHLALRTILAFALAALLWRQLEGQPASPSMTAHFIDVGQRWLDADVIQVSHHGAQNGTTPELVAVVSPALRS